LSAVRIFVDPPSHHFLRDRLFDRMGARYAGDDLHAPYRHLREWFEAHGVEVRTADYLMDERVATSPAVYISLGMLDKYRILATRPSVTVSAFFAFECPIVEPRMYKELPRAQRFFRRIFSWTDADTLLPFTGTPVRLDRFWWPQSYDEVHERLWNHRDRGFLVMINTNKLPRLYRNELYTERMRAVAFFTRTNEIDLYGRGWDGPSVRVGRTRSPYTFKRFYLAARRTLHRYWPDPLLVSARQAWKGTVESKSETLARYRFALCFENATIKGWITEKLFDCFFAGTVPVYWGAPDVTDYVPSASFIDMRSFSGYDELRRYLHALAPLDVERYREAARAFLASAEFQRFTKQAFVDLVASIVREDTGWNGGVSRANQPQAQGV
jgi:alpha(1,3/1,4) fucosyltransferase